MTDHIRYGMYGSVTLAGIVTMWKYNGIDAAFITLFVWMSGFLLGAIYQRNHPEK